MLIADPSSTCDVCFENFSSSRECWCIPCGHIFCRECLSRLTQFTCPVCRASIGDASYVFHPARKVHVDMSKCEGEVPREGPRSHKTRHLKTLEQRLATEASDGRRLTVQRAANLADEVGEFLRTQSPNEYPLLRTIESVLSQLSISLARVYEDTSLSQAVRASYEHRIKQLEQSLKEQTRPLGRDERNKTSGDPERYRSRMPPSTPHPQSSHAPRHERTKVPPRV